MRYCIDIDGVIVEDSPFHANQTYKKRESQLACLLELQKDNELVYYTSRPNSSYKETVDYLNALGLDTSHGVFFDKPYADYYIDDKMLDIVPANHAKLDRKKLAICWSGGMDSFIAYHYAIKELKYSPDDIICINFDLGHNYSEKERVAREALGIPFVTIPVGLIQPDVLGNAVDKDNYIIPARNMIFASIASGFGERVWIVGVKFENHYKMFDKNRQFFRAASLAMAQACGATTTVESPFINWTKTEMIEWAVRNGLQEGLSRTVSCYHDTEKRCGNCGLCFKRAVAMCAAYHHDELTEYKENPLTSETAKSFLRAYREADAKKDYSHYSKERIDEVWSVYESMCINVDWLIGEKPNE